MRCSLLAGVFVSPLLMLSLAGPGAAQAPEPNRTSGPIVHENLAVYFIHGKSAPGKVPLTLEEAMATGTVKVRETSNVNQLEIENLGDDEVFVQSGDIVKGGAQDRTLKDDIILPAKSGRVNISAFCVEHGRWSRRGNESVATFDSATDAIATKDLKIAVRMKEDQRSVWDKVAAAQASISSALRTDVRAPASPTSMPMTMQSPVVQKSTDAYLADLKKIVDGKPDVIGYAFAINGKVNSADVYASHELFTKLWLKLLRASAIEAVSEYDASKKFPAATVAVVRSALADADSGKASARQLTDRTSVQVKETAHNVVFETRDRAQSDAWIHRSYMTK